MKIEWSIKKKKGNFRPGLSYRITLEDFEQELAVSMVNIQSKIPEIIDSHDDFCFPDCHERCSDWQPAGFHWISTPYFKDGASSGFIRLPFRETANYPEVENSFEELRDKHESLIKNAFHAKSVEEFRELDFTDPTKQAIAGVLTAKRMLDFCK